MKWTSNSIVMRVLVFRVPFKWDFFIRVSYGLVCFQLCQLSRIHCVWSMGCWVIWGSCCSVPCGLDPPDSLYNFIMIEKGSPKSTTGRMSLILPTKNISIKTFFNEKLSNEHSITYLHCSNSSFRNQYNIIQNRYKISSFTP